MSHSLTSRRTQLIVAIALSARFYMLGQPAQSKDGPVKDKVVADGSGLLNGMLSGRVVDAGTGHPISSVTVVLFFTTSAEAQTDVNGNFRFDQLPSGRHGIRLSRATGFVTTSQFVNLQHGMHSASIELKARRASQITGRVETSKRTPLSGVSVSLVQAGDAASDFVPGRAGVAETNNKGEYILTNVQPGQYVILVRPKGFPIGLALKAPITTQDPEHLLSMADVWTYYPRSTSRAGAVPVSVGVDQDLQGYDITIGQAETACVQFKTIKSQLPLLAKVEIALRGELFLDTATIAEGKVDPSVEGLKSCGIPTGDYRLFAKAPSEVGNLYASFEFRVGRRGADLPDIVLQPLRELRGIVVVDRDGQHGEPSLLPPMVVNLSPMGRPLDIDEKNYASVSPDGQFLIPRLIPDNYRLHFAPAGGYYLKSATFGSVDVMHSPVIPNGEELRLVLSAEGGSVEVQVVDAEGAPVSSATVLLGRDPRPDQYAAEAWIKSTDTKGIASFAGLAPDEYRLLIYRDRPAVGVSPSWFFRSHERGAKTIKVGARERKTIRVETKE